MAEDKENKNNSCSETIPYDVSKLSSLQYIKVIYTDTDNELYEMNTEIITINNQVIQLYFMAEKDINISCPTGIVIKLVTTDAIHYAKTILREVKKIGRKYLFNMDAPKKTIRQQNRKHCRVKLNCPAVILVNDDKGYNQVNLTQADNISMGGVLLCGAESMLNDDEVRLKLGKDDICHLVLFIEHNFIVKIDAKLVRIEHVGDSYKYAFQFAKMPAKYVNPLNKYITNEQIKTLKAVNTNTKGKVS